MTSAGRLPNFILIGASRAGTTTIFERLARHPQVCASSKKETRYFQAVRYGEPLAALREYEAFFRPKPGHIVVMESTPDYLYGAERTARAIKKVCDPRVGIILREPVSRTISFFKLMRSGLQIPANMPFDDYVQRCLSLPDDGMDRRENNPWTGVWTSEYARFLPSWLAAFNGFCDVMFFDDLSNDPESFFRNLCVRIGVHPAQLPSQSLVANESRRTRNAALQRLAAAVSKRGRAVWYYHPRLAAAARGIYGAMNQRPADDVTIPGATVARLSAHFAPWNAELRAQLQRAGVTGLPVWLSSG